MDNDEPIFICPNCGEQERRIYFTGTETNTTSGTATIINHNASEGGYYLEEEIDETEREDSITNYYTCIHCEYEIDANNISEHIATTPEQPTKIRNISESQKIIDPEKTQTSKTIKYENLPGTTSVAECPKCGNSFSIEDNNKNEEITCTNPDCDTTFTLAEIIKNKNANNNTSLTTDSTDDFINIILRR